MFFSNEDECLENFYKPQHKNYTQRRTARADELILIPHDDELLIHPAQSRHEPSSVNRRFPQNFL